MISYREFHWHPGQFLTCNSYVVTYWNHRSGSSIGKNILSECEIIKYQMVFPEVKLKRSATPIFATYCIDYRYDALSSNFLKAIGYANSYYLATNAGASLPLGYKKTCKSGVENKSGTCCPGIDAMNILKNSLVTNLDIALTLKPITVVYLLNHQDCGAIRAFLPCSGYPAVGEQNKKKEICINAGILTSAQKYVKKNFKNMEIPLGLIDSNGTVGDYNVKTKKWSIIYVGSGKNKDGLWYRRKKGETITINC
jgi:hypothetical protein